MKKILFVVNEASYFFSHRLSLAKAVQKLGWEIHVAVPHLTASVQESFQNHQMTPHEFLPADSSFKELKGIIELKGIVNHIDPDLVHLITLKSSLRWFLILFSTHKRRSVHTVAGFGQLAGSSLKARIGKTVMKLVLAILSRLSPSLYVVQNPDDAAELCRQHIIPAGKLFLVQGSGVDTDIYKNIAKDKGTTLHVGTACRRLASKGLGALMNVAALIKEKDLPIQIHVASVPVPPSHSEAIGEIDWNNWKAQNLFIDEGQVTDMPAYYAKLDAFIYLSTSGEGLAKTLLEAASSALPVITTSQPGCKEAIIDGVSGFIVDPHDSTAIVEHLKSLQDASSRHLMGEAGRTHILNNFSDAIVVQRMLGLYQKAETL